MKPELPSATEAQPAQPLTSEPVEPQSASGAASATENSSGIAPVAQFIPSDAKLDQPIISPTEPLTEGQPSVDNDTQMNDAPSQDNVPPAVDSAQPSKSAAEIVGGIEPAPVDSATSVPTPPEEKPELTNGKTEEPQVAVSGDQTAPSTVEIAAAPAKGTATPQIVEPADQPMMDTPSSGTVRPRDEADLDDEPAAKRARTEDPIANASAETKESATSAPPGEEKAAPVVTNGDSSMSSAPASAAAPATAQAPAPAPASTVPSFSKEPMKPTQKTILIEKIKNTKKVKSAQFFLKPVDPIALNIPHYTTIIQHPMDLGTMEKKLKADQYACIDDFVADFELIITNCVTFNGPQHPVSIAGQNLRAYFMKQMETVPTGISASAVPPKAKKASPKPPPRRESRVHATPGAARSPTETKDTYALLPSGTPMIRRDSSAGRPKRAVIPPQRDLPYNQVKPRRRENTAALKFCDHILEEFKKPKNMKLTSAFLLPVDPVALNIPTYFKVVKKPMDLQTMTNKLKTQQYGNAEEFRDDFILMIENCFAFNPPGNPVHEQGKELRSAFDREWSRKDVWIKKNTPQSQRASPASDVESDGDESDADEEDGEADSNEATIAMLRQQLVNMQNTIASISGAKPPKPKKKKGSSATSKPSKKASVSAPKTTIKAKPKKQRMVTYEEKQEISNATENMNDEQINKLTSIITDNVSKYKVSFCTISPFGMCF